MNGVFNGCEKQEKAEIAEEEALDCVHEMDTINHYVGMYPIAAGGPVERGFSQFLMAFLGVMLIGFIFTSPKQRMVVLSVGFVAIAAWMALTIYSSNGFELQNKGYVSVLVTSLDQEATGETSEPEIVIGGIAGMLKESLEESGVEVILPSQVEAAKKAGQQSAGADKTHLIKQLKLTYDIDQVKSDSLKPWDGSAFQVMSWHYAKSLGRYFNNPQEIEPMVKNLELAVHLVFYAILGAMALVVFGSRKNSGLLYWLLIVVPIALPLFFVIDYSAWLWWYGHTLNDMGAFSVKPFMPTVFGDGKVAQFTTHSYPYIGFGLMVLMSLVLAMAALLRFKQLKD
ncbi:MAG: hypothetical protein KME56_08210 [Candidatus Thiodiazotropha sp. (ex Ctena orbiculata)]|nr:hypothetical protein [Candidatus Thiodiazotropha taylori]MBT2996600.1 hypothetical protein [Candidatus Thiodiazotropha taylori]MBT3000640.1 hypothetical protein [Candidatus Thiodiazotropha taylori]MBV2106969.1 hypothetical protein [Candidatus Thiodiazotropha taylori]MBV2111093.1 hypothetical protein [Candidatus Thiodiazotropha taylori]